MERLGIQAAAGRVRSPNRAGATVKVTDTSLEPRADGTVGSCGAPRNPLHTRMPAAANRGSIDRKKTRRRRESADRCGPAGAHGATGVRMSGGAAPGTWLPRTGSPCPRAPFVAAFFRKGTKARRGGGRKGRKHDGCQFTGIRGRWPCRCRARCAGPAIMSGSGRPVVRVDVGETRWRVLRGSNPSEAGGRRSRS